MSNEQLELRPAVAWFAQQMEAALRRNDHKGGWDACKLDYLWNRLEGERQELGFAVGKYKVREFAPPVSPEEITMEAADVANFAMMIADNLGPRIGHAKAIAAAPRSDEGARSTAESAVPVSGHSPKNNEEQSEDAALPDGRWTYAPVTDEDAHRHALTFAAHQLPDGDVDFAEYDYETFIRALKYIAESTNLFRAPPTN